MGPCRVSENNDHPLARLQETWRLEQNMYGHLIEVGTLPSRAKGLFSTPLASYGLFH
jgi:hypothetical protein